MVAGLDVQPPALGHRITRVGGQVDQDLLDLPLVHLDPPQLRCAVEHHLDTVGQQLPEERLEFAKHAVHIHNRGLHRLPSAEGEELLGDRRGPIDRLLHVAQILGARARFRRQVAAEQFGVSADDRQQVVEIVRETAGEMADRIQFLRVLQLPLELVAFRHIAAVEDDAVDGRVVQEIAPDDFHFPPGSVSRPHAMEQRTGRAGLFEDRAQRGVILHEIVQAPAGSQTVRTDQTLARRARVRDDAIWLDDQHDVRRMLDERPEAGLLRELGREEPPVLAELGKLPEQQQKRHHGNRGRREPKKLAISGDDLRNQQHERERHDRVRERVALIARHRPFGGAIRSRVAPPRASGRGPAQYPGREPQSVGGIADAVPARMLRVDVVREQIHRVCRQQDAHDLADLGVTLLNQAHRSRGEEQPVEHGTGNGDLHRLEATLLQCHAQDEVEGQYGAGNQRERRVCEKTCPRLTAETPVGKGEVCRQREDVLDELELIDPPRPVGRIDGANIEGPRTAAEPQRQVRRRQQAPGDARTDVETRHPAGPPGRPGDRQPQRQEDEVADERCRLRARRPKRQPHVERSHVAGGSHVHQWQSP